MKDLQHLSKQIFYTADLLRNTKRGTAEFNKIADDLYAMRQLNINLGGSFYI